ncbi:MAG: tRNA epoxyqueuosine(34) reductase QueG [Gemmatimonadota bacterium]
MEQALLTGTVSTTQLGESIRAEALRIGFDMVGITDVRPSEHAAFYRAWIEGGRHGTMDYLAREDAVERRLCPDSGFPELKSAVVVALNYHGEAESESVEAQEGRGVIARYARGRDYHKVIRKKLLALLEFAEAELGRELPRARAYVDTGPVLERELAQRAGLGWFGRSTMLVNPRRGSYFFLGSLLLDVELPADAPFEADHCGTCNACVTACPTGALLGRDDDGAPVIDATRCISYLTIENRGPIPRELRPLIGNRIFGCDICQEVCPFSRKFSTTSSEAAFVSREPGEPPADVERLASDGWHPGTQAPSLIDLMSMDGAGWEGFSRGSPLRRAGWAGFRRNVAVALGNWGDEAAVPSLGSGLSDPDPLVRSHSAWALGRVASGAAVAALVEALGAETDQGAIDEIRAALAAASSTSADANE